MNKLKKLLINKRWFFLLIVFFCKTVLAASITSNVEATLHNVITLTENKDIQYNNIPSGSGQCVMALSGALSDHCAGLPIGQPAEFTITGTPNELVNIWVSNGSTQNGVTIVPKLDDGGATTSSSSLDSNGEAIINVVADLNLVTANSGIRHLTYILSVNYQ